MKLGAAFPSKWLRADDCEDSDLILTVESAGMEDVQGQGAIERKLVLRFREDERGLILNKTNATSVGKIHGDDTDDWIGKRIALYATEVQFGNETMMGIRVRLKAPKAAGGAQPARAGAAKAPVASGAVANDDDEDIPF